MKLLALLSILFFTHAFAASNPTGIQIIYDEDCYIKVGDLLENALETDRKQYIQAIVSRGYSLFPKAYSEEKAMPALEIYLSDSYSDEGHLSCQLELEVRKYGIFKEIYSKNFDGDENSTMLRRNLFLEMATVNLLKKLPICKKIPQNPKSAFEKRRLLLNDFVIVYDREQYELVTTIAKGKKFINSCHEGTVLCNANSIPDTIKKIEELRDKLLEYYK